MFLYEVLTLGRPVTRRQARPNEHAVRVQVLLFHRVQDIPELAKVIEGSVCLGTMGVPSPTHL